VWEWRQSPWVWEWGHCECGNGDSHTGCGNGDSVSVGMETLTPGLGMGTPWVWEWGHGECGNGDTHPGCVNGTLWECEFYDSAFTVRECENVIDQAERQCLAHSTACM